MWWLILGECTLREVPLFVSQEGTQDRLVSRGYLGGGHPKTLQKRVGKDPKNVFLLEEKQNAA